MSVLCAVWFMGLPVRAESPASAHADRTSESEDASEPSSDEFTPRGENAVPSTGPDPENYKSEIDVAACLRVHEEAQVARLDGRLLEAERHLARCGTALCPAALRRDCLRWQEESKSIVPSVIIVAIANDGDVEVADIFMDGVLVREHLDGRAIRADPGTRVMRVVLPDGRALERRVVLSEGQAARRFAFDFRTPPPESSQPVPEPEPVPEPPVQYARPIPTATYVLGGIAIASASVSAVFGLDAYIKSRTARRECAPLCSEEDSRAVSERAAVADVAFGLAAASAISASVLYFFRPAVVVEPSDPHSVRLDLFVGATPRGGSLEVWGRF